MIGKLKGTIDEIGEDYVVVDVHGQVTDAVLHRHAFRERPAHQDAVSLEPEVVMQPACGVLLNHIA